MVGPAPAGVSARARAMLRAGQALLTSLVVIAAVASAAEPRLETRGGCRDGLANGAYELRSDDGQLRVAGAFHMGKRTGTFIFWSEGGHRIAAIPYDEGVQNGTIALWHPPGRNGTAARHLEAPVQRGHAHGVRRSWYRNGQPRTEAEYADDHLVRVLGWDPSGRPVSPEAAGRLERDDVAAVTRELAALEGLVAAHPPDCAATGSLTFAPLPERGVGRSQT